MREWPLDLDDDCLALGGQLVLELLTQPAFDGHGD